MGIQFLVQHAHTHEDLEKERTPERIIVFLVVRNLPDLMEEPNALLHQTHHVSKFADPEVRRNRFRHVEGFPFELRSGEGQKGQTPR